MQHRPVTVFTSVFVVRLRHEIELLAFELKCNRETHSGLPVLLQLPLVCWRRLLVSGGSTRIRQG